MSINIKHEARRELNKRVQKELAKVLNNDQYRNEAILTYEGLEELKKYRVIQKGNKWLTQRRFLIFFWLTLAKSQTSELAYERLVQFSGLENFITPFMSTLLIQIFKK